MAGNNKTWKDVWDLYWNEKVRDLHTSFPARITRIDHTLNRCDVQPSVSTKYADQRQDVLPELTGLPYQIYSADAGKARITVPLKVGDIVEVSVSEREFSLFLESNGSSTYDTRSLSTHNLNSAMVKPCFYTAQTAKVVDPDRIVIENGTTSIKIAPDGDITIDSTTKATVTVPETEFNSNVTINGTLDVTEAVTMNQTLAVTGAATYESTIEATGDVTAAGISVSTHTHGGVQTGGGNTGAPQ